MSLNKSNKQYSVSITRLLGIAIISLTTQPLLAAGGATDLRAGSNSLAGGSVNVHIRGGGDVRWILPGKRRLDPAVFGTPAAPLGFEPGVGLPIAARLTNDEGTAWTTSAMPTPFSDNYKMIDGKFKLHIKDRSIYDSPLSRDAVKLEAKFSSPDQAYHYRLTVNKVIPVGPDHPFLGGVGTNFVQHGMTGIGTKMMPTAFTYSAFWGVGTLEVNGIEVANNRIVHMMTTCAVRDADYRLVFDDGVDCTRLQTHLLLPPRAVSPQGPVMSPVPSGFILPNGMEQPFMHIMFGDNKVSGVKTSNRMD